MKLNDLGEFGLIEMIRGIVGPAGENVIKGIGDDCAVVESSNDKVMLLTTDVLVEGVHFTKGFMSPENLGRKALAVNISDIAAMGGKPLYALLSLGAPESTEIDYLDKLVSGMSSLAAEYKIDLIGGDTSLSPELLFINIFLVGESSKDKVLYRSGAGVDQVIFVTGEVGSSAAGLDILKRALSIKKYGSLTGAHVSPHPHLKEGEIISSSGFATSLIDISDGVMADLGNICRESKVGALVRESDLPISEECRQYCHINGPDATDFALYGGEDYVLMGTVPEHLYYKLRDSMNSGGCSVYPIGRTKEETGIKLQGRDGAIAEIEPNGYDHFKDRRK
ncbi:MAG: thiamine-phosphate kinase [Candidatus Zixiibacteriota bacterium]|nr:MAG: thiamine-phosphate kinase [candidate division Zixibacteria bacterium]